MKTKDRRGQVLSPDDGRVFYEDYQSLKKALSDVGQLYEVAVDSRAEANKLAIRLHNYARVLGVKLKTSTTTKLQSPTKLFFISKKR